MITVKIKERDEEESKTHPQLEYCLFLEYSFPDR
jgi:hypothetical protein